ncbi:hypothetical protein LSAT2_015921 [Lamellibrachia satsuma]|nr:hypothetical protein LSAT2_015921 [Lamellibrachia satsuma]
MTTCCDVTSVYRNLTIRKRGVNDSNNYRYGTTITAYIKDDQTVFMDDIVAASHEIQHGRLNKDAFVAAGANEAAGFSVVLIRFNCDTRTKRGVVRDAESRGGNEAWTPRYVRR